MALFIVTGLYAAPEAGASDSWPSWRHDLQNTGAAPDSGYPTTLKLLWDKTRTNDPFYGHPARVPPLLQWEIISPFSREMMELLRRGINIRER